MFHAYLQQANRVALCAGLVFLATGTLAAAENSADPYEHYIKTSKDFKRVKQDKEWCYKAWPGWIYMPWYAQWTIGQTDAGGKFSQDSGYNGAFTDHGNAGYLDWINKYKLRFYNDHTAAKGYLHIRPKSLKKGVWAQVKNRTPLLDDALKTKLKGIIKKNINKLKSSPYRSAYSLDDEISWGAFVKPCMWKITGDGVYRNWLKEVYGKDHAPANKGWVSYDSVREKLGNWTLAQFDCHQFMDQLTFNDSHWANYLGELVEYGNSVDPDIPVGYVGSQSPNAFGGFDYAKIMRKIQFIEAYGLADTQSVVRSFNSGNAIPTVSTHFHKTTKDTIWQTWYSLAHGNRGHIGWVAKWFDGKTPKPWHKVLAPHYKEAGQKIGPLMAKAEWKHDNVAIYYNHASIQMSWILDAASHGKTWPNRNGDGARGTSHLVRRAWRKMLQDEGLQFTFINYVDVIQKGVPSEYNVLILPAVYCLSDAEARQIKAFCQNGGTVIGDFMTGVFDQHGKGRKGGGALDEMFGIKQDMSLRQNDVFTKGVWVEVNQDTNWGTAGKYQQFLTNKNTSTKDASGFNKAVAKMKTDHVQKHGKGAAVFMNLSPQWYLAYRQAADFEACKKREVFMKHVKSADVKRWVALEGAGEKEFGYEISYWQKGNRTILFLCTNPESVVGSLGGGNSVGLKTAKFDVTLKFSQAVKKVKNERTGKDLGSGSAFKASWVQNEAVVLSFER